MPQHIGFIMDGNRRFAKRLMKRPWMGHVWGSEKVKSIIEWSNELGIYEITLYSLSVDNFNRPEKELEALMKIFRKELEDKRLLESIEKNKINMRFIGEISRLPKDIIGKIKDLEEKTNDYGDYRVNIAISYGGHDEILNATRKIAYMISEGTIKPEDISKKTIKDNLYLKDSPDMIIRTGGEKRLSAFLTWQSTYSELFFTDTLWPEFDKEEFISLIGAYKKRKRRFGK